MKERRLLVGRAIGARGAPSSRGRAPAPALARFLGAAVVALVLLAACAEGETEVHSVRGQVVRVVDAGRTVIVDHEAVPGRMEAMRMTLPLQDPSRSASLEAGDKIRFDLTISRGRGSMGSFEKLPPDAALELAPVAEPD